MRVLLFSIFLFISTLLADGLGWKEVEDIYKKVQAARKGTSSDADYQAFYMQEIKQEEADDQSLCIDCIQLLPLANEVNKIVQKLAEEEHKKDPSKFLLEEVRELEGMYYYTLESSSNSINQGENSDECHKILMGNFLDDHPDFKLDESRLLFTMEFDIRRVQKIQSFSRRTKKKAYFFRGVAEDRNIVIRIDLNADGKSSISYYKIKEIMKPKSAFPKVAKEKKSSEKSWGFWDRFESDQLEDDRFSVDYGFKVDRDGFIPKEVTVLDARGQLNVSEGIKLTTQAQIGSDGVGAEVGIQDNEGDEIANLRASTSGVSLQVPMNFEVYNTGLDLDGEVIVGQENEGRMNFVYEGVNLATTKIEYKGDDEVNLGLGHHSDLGNSQSLSVEYEYNDILRDTNHSVYIRYNFSF